MGIAKKSKVIKLNGNLLKRNPKDYKLKEQTFVLKKQLRNLIKRNKYTQNICSRQNVHKP